ncbi:MAG: triple tyrosine motif-containing protein [Cytophagales bacterium]|nr:triple tyrosine motif-containing protein [Cytophagales bacterium]
MNPLKGQFLGLPSIEIYSFKDYSAGGQNYQIRQSEEGLIYIANNFGLLSFDGTYWHTDSIDGGTKVRSVYPHTSGKVYVGAQNEFGYFAPGANGFLSYNSLTDLIPEDHRSFEDVWKICDTEYGISFTTTGGTYFFKDEQITFIESSIEPGFALEYKGELLTKHKFSDVHLWKDGKWTVRPRQPKMTGGLVSIVDLGNDRELWVSRQGIQMLDGDQEKPFLNADLVKRLEDADISKAIRLLNGSIAIATIAKGLFIIDSETGALDLHMDENNGLVGHTVYDVIEDRNGSLWLSMTNNIVRISWSYPFSFINSNLNVPGTGYTAQMSNDKLYLGTNTGLYVGDMPFPTFERVEGIEGQINTIQKVDGQIIVSAHEGVFLVENGRIEPIEKSEGWWSVIPTKNPEYFIAGTYEGLGLLSRKNGEWQVVKRYEGFGESSRVLAFDQSGDLWMAHGYRGVYRFRMSKSYDQIKEVSYFGPESGLPSQYLNNVFSLSEGLVFTGETGVYQFDKATEMFERHTFLDTLIGHGEHTRIIKPVSNDQTFVITRDFSAVMKSSQWTGISMDKNPFIGVHHLLNDDLIQVSVIDENNILFSANEGFLHYNNNYGLLNKEINVLIRSVYSIHADSVLYGGYGGFDHTGEVSFPYHQNSVAFTYSSIDYQFHNCEYRYRLVGYKDEQWSSWSGATFKEFTNLYEGDYEFQVEAKDALGNVSPMTSYAFEVDPPWFRTTIAYSIMVLSIVMTIFFSANWYRQRHKRIQKRLIAEQKQELDLRDKELIQLRNEKLRAEVNTKRKELATSTMHLIDKNEFMNQIKQHLLEIKKSLDGDAVIMKNLNRLVKDIDKNIDQDRAWKQFEINFDEVHGDFLKTIQSDYPVLSPQDLKLCAYLRMNMTTKEIANLLKISVRGVEIARYRLRKKLALNHDKNLVDFMIKYGTEQAMVSAN